MARTVKASSAEECAQLFGSEAFEVVSVEQRTDYYSDESKATAESLPLDTVFERTVTVYTAVSIEDTPEE